MANHIGLAAVHVSNQDRALDFYQNKLGFEVITDQDEGPGLRWIEVAPAGQEDFVLALVKPKQLEGHVGGHRGIAWVVDDVRATCWELKERGVPFDWGPVKNGWWEAQFMDPDKNKILIVDPLYHKRPED